MLLHQQPIEVAVVCASNQNRSMAAHHLLQKNGFNVNSFGTGSHVKLPGKSLYTPNVYDFGTAYEEMLKDLVQKDEKLYVQLVLQCVTRVQQLHCQRTCANASEEYKCEKSARAFPGECDAL